VRAGARPHELLPDTEKRVRQQHIVLPGLTVLEKLIGTARAESEEKLFQEIASRAGEEVKGVLLANDTVGEVRELTEIREKIEVMSLRDLNQEAH
jgi:hypothetical protein